METWVLVRSGPKPYAANPPPQWCSRWNLITIGQLVSEIFMFESVDARTHGRRLESHTISSPWAFVSGELKMSQHTWYGYLSQKSVINTHSGASSGARCLIFDWSVREQGRLCRVCVARAFIAHWCAKCQNLTCWSKYDSYRQVLLYLLCTRPIISMENSCTIERAVGSKMHDDKTIPFL